MGPCGFREKRITLLQPLKRLSQTDELAIDHTRRVTRPKPASALSSTADCGRREDMQAHLR